MLFYHGSLPDAVLLPTWLSKQKIPSHLGGVLGRLGYVMGRLGRVFGRLEVSLGPSWGILVASWRRLGGILGLLGRLLGRSALSDPVRRRLRRGLGVRRGGHYQRIPVYKTPELHNPTRPGPEARRISER